MVARPKKSETKKVKNEKENKKPKAGKFFSGTGRRKNAVARVWLRKEKGEFLVNGHPIDDYFSPLGGAEKEIYVKPFHAVGISHPKALYSLSIKVHGSGKSSQLDAVVLGISKALVEMDEDNRASLGKSDFLKRDPRMKERKKYYLKKARKRPQYSKR